MRILIVDDCSDARALLVKYLSSLGQCDIASDGHEAVHAVRMTCNQNDPYHLILLDIMMPQMDGYRALEEIRKLEEDRCPDLEDGPKIIMVTALSGVREVMKAFLGLCDGYLVKPIVKKALFEQIEKLGLGHSVPIELGQEMACGAG